MTDTEENFQEFLSHMRFLRSLSRNNSHPNRPGQNAHESTIQDHDGSGDETGAPLPDVNVIDGEEAVYRLIEAQGITRQEFQRRLRRLNDIRERVADPHAFQERVVRQLDNEDRLEALEELEVEESALSNRTPLQAQVEDVSDEDNEL